jgi:hypothetical protein
MHGPLNVKKHPPDLQAEWDELEYKCARLLTVRSMKICKLVNVGYKHLIIQPTGISSFFNPVPLSLK